MHFRKLLSVGLSKMSQWRKTGTTCDAWICGRLEWFTFRWFYIDEIHFFIGLPCWNETVKYFRVATACMNALGKAPQVLKKSAMVVWSLSPTKLSRPAVCMFILFCARRVYQRLYTTMVMMMTAMRWWWYWMKLWTAIASFKQGSHDLVSRGGAHRDGHIGSIGRSD